MPFHPRKTFPQLKKSMKRTTLKDLAKKLNLSVATVSRALADGPNIRKETKDRVLKAAEEMNYKPNTIASHLRTGRTGAVGVVVDELITPFVAQALRGIQRVLHPEGTSILMACSYNDPAQEIRNLQMMEEAQVDGLIVFPCHDTGDTDVYLRLIEKNIPVVFIGRNPGDIHASEIAADHHSKVYFLVDHLVRTGRTKVAHVTGNNPSPYFNLLQSAFTEALGRHRLTVDPDLIVGAKPTFEGGVAAVDELLRRGKDFDAVFAAADLQAIGVMNCLLEKGVRIPEDVAVAGYAGSYLAKMVFPQLTTVEPPLVEMGEKAAHLVMEKINDPSAPDRMLKVDAKILLRHSTHGPGYQ